MPTYDDIYDVSVRSRDFVMAEFGTGFGKWELESIHLDRRMGVYVRAILVEADPTHVAYIRDVIQVAGVPLVQVQVLDAAIGGRDGVGEMVVGNAEAWCGQNLVSVRQLLSPESVVVESVADSKAHQHTQQQHTHTSRPRQSVSADRDCCVTADVACGRGSGRSLAL
jgi:hypothetical protein